MKKKLIVTLSLVMMLALVSCNIPLKKVATPTPTLPPTPTAVAGMQLYYGEGMQIMLPPTFVAEDISSKLPSIIETITNLVGSTEGFAGDLINDLEGNVSWYGYDSGTPAVYPTRLIVIKNKSLASLPVSVISFGLEQLLNRDEAIQVDRDSLTLNGRDVTRFSYSKDGSAWSAYIFKEQSRLWISVFITTSANMAASLGDYDTSIGSMTIDPITE